MLNSVLTGFAFGAFHVLGGVDHLVAMAPNAINKPKFALRDGLAWGLGHSVGVLILASLAVLAKDLVDIQELSTFAEFVVGITLLLVGVFAIRTSLGLSIHKHKHNHGSRKQHQHLHLHFLGRKIHGPHTHAATGLGLIHGMAGASHLLAVFPALALPFLGAIAYMVAYLLGSIFAMSSVVMGISYTSMKAGSKTSPLLMGGVGGLSIATGCFWLHQSPVLGL
tara:strand:+ start:5304 stop:5972 length:669 start_codon:yes stop_codon:yes gene_type:complete